MRTVVEKGVFLMLSPLLLIGAALFLLLGAIMFLTHLVEPLWKKPRTP